MSNAELYPIGTDRLLDMIEKTLFSISTDDARANLTGAFLRVIDEGNLLMVSTDGHRLSKIEMTPDSFDAKNVPDALRQGIIVPRKGLSELKRTVDAKSEDLSFGIVDNSIVFRHGPNEPLGATDRWHLPPTSPWSYPRAARRARSSSAMRSSNPCAS